MAARGITPRIVAIGGGQLHEGETMAIDRHIVRLAGKRRPRALFIPTASGDAPGYVKTFEKVYGGRLGCRTEALTLLRNRPSRRRAREMILGADLIYVGGGSTLRMMRAWRRFGVDRLLREAGRRGVVLSGLSAGAICWFAHGHSDSLRKARVARAAGYVRVEALGIIDAIFCPHYHAEKRESSLAKMIRKHRAVTIACDDRAAIEIAGNRWRTLRSRRSAKAYRLVPCRDGLWLERLPKDRAFRPLSGLLDKRPGIVGTPTRVA